MIDLLLFTQLDENCFLFLKRLQPVKNVFKNLCKRCPVKHT